jgi:hypothetical protein
MQRLGLPHFRKKSMFLAILSCLQFLGETIEQM